MLQAPFVGQQQEQALQGQLGPVSEHRLQPPQQALQPWALKSPQSHPAGRSTAQRLNPPWICLALPSPHLHNWAQELDVSTTEQHAQSPSIASPRRADDMHWLASTH